MIDAFAYSFLCLMPVIAALAAVDRHLAVQSRRDLAGDVSDRNRVNAGDQHSRGNVPFHSATNISREG